MTDLLVPFDNSPPAVRALDLAIDLARARAGTTLHVLSVLDSVGLDTRELIDAAEIEKVLAAEAAEMLDPARARVGAAREGLPGGGGSTERSAPQVRPGQQRWILKCAY